MTETEYVSQLLGKVRRFAQHYGVHVWFVAHPAKMPRDSSGSRPVPTLYDISGSANWVNKADIGIVIHRDIDKDPAVTEIQVRKVRFKSVGKIGTVALRWDRVTGRYAEMTASAAPRQILMLQPISSGRYDHAGWSVVSPSGAASLRRVQSRLCQ
jgi:twinkle protein